MAGARHYSELISWQLADALRVKTLKLTRRLPFARDFKHQAQAEDAIDSICRNIAEGFGCSSHAEFARFLEYSRRSLNELMDSFRSAQLKGYVSAEEIGPIRALARRLYPALNGFIAYLRRNPTRPPRTDNRQRHNPPVVFRRHLIDLLSHEPRSISSLAHELGMTRGDVEEDLRHALRSARAAGHHIEVIPARCKTCDFVFSTDKLTKPSRCPACKGTRLYEPMMQVRTDQR